MMPVVLATFAAGDPIDATVLRALQAQVETYLNEGLVAGDRASGWMRANHVYRPDFFGAPNPHTTLTTGESYHRTRGASDDDRAFFSWYAGNGPYPVPGLCATIQVPETLSQGSVYYRTVISGSFYVYEYGGDDIDPAMDEMTYVSAYMQLRINESIVGTQDTYRRLFKGSLCSGATYKGAFYPRKQHSFVHGRAGSGTIAPGVNNIAVTISPLTAAANEWKFIIFQQGNLVVRYPLR